MPPKQVHYFFEAQSRSLYQPKVPETVVVHETAHQWFGNSVTPATWKAIWLNEGLARWIEWLWWSEQPRPASLKQRFDLTYENAKYPGTKKAKEYWDPPPARPTRRTLFDRTIYDRGAMTIQALYDEVGRQTLFEILRTWVSRFRYGNASTRDFIGLSEEISGRSLDKFFRVWLYERGRPLDW